jgi:uncharacterized protein DUF2846
MPGRQSLPGRGEGDMRTRTLLPIFALVLLAGCASTGADLAAVSAAAPKLGANNGRVYFYRSASIVGAVIQPEIRLNGQPVGTSVPGGSFFVDRPRGSYAASTSTEVETQLNFTLAPGETKYIRTSISPGVVAGHMNFELVSKSVAESEMTR